jgi:phage-related minor tail protein
MASGRVKGITVEIDGDTTGLQDALKNVDSSLKNTQAQLKDVNKLLKMDPHNTERLRQKQELLSKAAKDVKDKLATEKEALKQLQAEGSTDPRAIEQQNALKREIIATEQELKNYQSQIKLLPPELQKVSDISG